MDHRGGVKRDGSALEALSGWTTGRFQGSEGSNGMQSEGQDMDTRLLSCWAQVGAELHTTGCSNCPAGGAVAEDHCSGLRSCN